MGFCTILSGLGRQHYPDGRGRLLRRWCRGLYRHTEEKHNCMKLGLIVCLLFFAIYVNWQLLSDGSLRPSSTLQGEWSEQVPSWEDCGKNQTACPDMYALLCFAFRILLGYLVDFCRDSLACSLVNSVIAKIFLYAANSSVPYLCES